MNSEKRTLISVKERGNRPRSIGNYVGDYADTFILLGSVLFTTVSVTLIIFVFVGQYHRWDHIPQVMVELQRVIAASSLTISSAVIVLVGKRYLFSRLAGNGIHSQRIVLYSNASITSLLGGIVQFRFEALSLALLVFWGVGFATGLTANYMVKFLPITFSSPMSLPAGSLDAQVNITALFSQTSSFLDLIMTGGQMDTSLSFVGELGVIDVVGAVTTTGKPMGRITYPPTSLQSIAYTANGRSTTASTVILSITDTDYTTPAVLNGFQIAVNNATEPDEHPSCTLDKTKIWFANADTQSLTLIIGWPIGGIAISTCPGVNTICNYTFGLGNGQGESASQAQASRYSTVTQYTATAVMIGGTLSRQANHTKFTVNGMHWPLTMSDTQWAMVMMDVICNASLAGASGLSVLDFGVVVNLGNNGVLYATADEVWTSVLSSIIGSYTVANPSPNFWPSVSVTFQDMAYLVLNPDYGVWVLIINVIISIIMLVVAWKFGRDSQLHPDFLNPTRILLDTSRNADLCLFNESLGSTVDALGNPCLQVIQDKDFDLDGLIQPFSPREALKSLPLSSSPSSIHSPSESHSSSPSNPRSAIHSRPPSVLYMPTETMFAPNEIIAPLLTPIELAQAQSRSGVPSLPSPTLSIPAHPYSVPDRVPNRE